MKYINTNPAYGEPGPWEAASKEELADEWEAKLDAIRRKKRDIFKLGDRWDRREFIDGLIEVEAE